MRIEARIGVRCRGRLQPGDRVFIQSWQLSGSSPSYSPWTLGACAIHRRAFTASKSKPSQMEQAALLVVLDAPIPPCPRRCSTWACT
jgi:hypothetical protein